MKHGINFHNSVLGLVLLGVGTSTGAIETGKGYFSAYIGSTETEASEDGVTAKGSDLSFRIGGGYRFNQNFALEGFYIDYGEAEDTVNLGFGPIDVTTEATALQVQGVGIFPVSPAVELYGKLGLALWDGEACAETFGCSDDDGSDLVLGFGGGYKFTPKITGRAEYEFSEFDDIDLSTIMIGVDIGF